MQRSRTAIVAMSGLVVLLLAGCGGAGSGNAGQGGAEGQGTMGADSGMQASTAPAQGVVLLPGLPDSVTKDPSCRKPSSTKPTGPHVNIQVRNDSISVDLDPVVQPVDHGAFIWTMSKAQQADSFRIEYENDSPILNGPVLGPADAGQSLVGLVNPEAACTDYKYTVWAKVASGWTSIDPHSPLVP